MSHSTKRCGTRVADWVPPRCWSDAGRPGGARAPGSTVRPLADRRLRWLPLDQGPDTTGNRAWLGKPNPAFWETGDPVIQLTTLVATGIHAQARDTDLEML